MLTNYTWCVLLYTADKVVHAYSVNIYSKYCGSHKILLDNRTEFRNELFMWVDSTLGMKQIFSFLYYPQGNGNLEHIHNFHKTCIWKDVSSELAWDEVTHIACTAYNFVLNEHSKESVLFLIFGQDGYTPLVQLLHLKLRYMGNDKSFLLLDGVRDMHM